MGGGSRVSYFCGLSISMSPVQCFWLPKMQHLSGAPPPGPPPRALPFESQWGLWRPPNPQPHGRRPHFSAPTDFIHLEACDSEERLGWILWQNVLRMKYTWIAWHTTVYILDTYFHAGGISGPVCFPSISMSLPTSGSITCVMLPANMLHIQTW